MAATTTPLNLHPIRRRMSTPAEEDYFPSRMTPRETSFVQSSTQDKHYPDIITDSTNIISQPTNHTSALRVQFRTHPEHDSMPQLPTQHFHSSISKSLLTEQLRKQSEDAGKHIERISDEEEEEETSARTKSLVRDTEHAMSLTNGFFPIRKLTVDEKDSRRRRHSCKDPPPPVLSHPQPQQQQPSPQVRKLEGSTVIVEERLRPSVNQDQHDNSSPTLAANIPYLTKFKRQRHMQWDPETDSVPTIVTKAVSNDPSKIAAPHAFTFDTMENTVQLEPEPIQQPTPARAMSSQDTLATRTRFLCDDPNSGNVTTIAESLRRPVIQLGKFGALHNWALDIFTLPHNAIRTECVDLFNILESIHVRSPQIAAMEMEEFNAWWVTFEIFIIEYFDFEADILFPWVFPKNKNESIIGLADIITSTNASENNIRSCLSGKKEEILETIRQLNGTFDLRHHVDIADSFQNILKMVNVFVPKLLDYFKLEERHLPTMVAHLHPSSSKEILTKKYLHYIKSGENPHINLILLSRWMDNDERDRWIRSNVRVFNRLMYKRWERKCHRVHGHIAFKFHRRLIRSVKNVAASRLRRRTEFGEQIDEISFGSLPSQGGSIRSLTLSVGNKVSQANKICRARDLQRAKTKTR